MRSRSLALIVSASLILASACATANADGTPLTAMQRAKQQCMWAVGIGAVGGAIIGNNTGDGNAGKGAAVGALAGGALCAVMLATASAEDQRRIAALETQALEAGAARQDSYVGADGKRRTFVVQAAPAADPMWSGAPSAADAATPASATEGAADPRICRTKQTTITVEGTGTGALGSELVCRNPETLAWEVQSV